MSAGESYNNFQNRVAIIDYTNWRGERATRTIHPIAGTLRFESNEWHPEPQWLFDATDVDTGKVRTFAMLGIHSWRLRRGVLDSQGASIADLEISLKVATDLSQRACLRVAELEAERLTRPAATWVPQDTGHELRWNDIAVGSVYPGAETWYAYCQDKSGQKWWLLGDFSTVDVAKAVVEEELRAK